MDDNLLEKPFTNPHLTFQTDVKCNNIQAKPDIKNTDNTQPLCHCYYPQPPDADLITEDPTFTEGVRRIYDSKETPLNRTKRKSLWKQPKKFTINCVIFVGSVFCFA